MVTMAVCSWTQLFFLSSILLNHVGISLARHTYLYHFCIDSGNYTNNSGYETNLNTLLTSLSSNIDIYGFYNASQGQSYEDIVNAMVLCRGDVELEMCRSCVNDLTIRLRQLCPNNTESIGWYDKCMLRYSDKTMFGTRMETPVFAMCNTQNVSSPEQFNPVLRIRLDSLRAEAASGGPIWKFASGNVSFTDGTELTRIYAIVQCTPDLSEMDCNDCLNRATEAIPFSCIGKVGGRIYRPSCNFRTELYPFYNETTAELPPPPPPPPPPAVESLTATSFCISGKENRTTGTVIVIIVPIVASLILTVCVCIFLRKRKLKEKFEKEKENRQDLQLLDLAGGRFSDDYTVENLQGEMNVKSQDYPSIKLDFILTATNHFSEENKLGEGGFGPVYKGTLVDGKEVAVKRLSGASGQGLQEFKNEVTLIARLQHWNLVRLLGCCIEGRELLLIYEYMPNKSLDVFLFDSTRGAELDWKKRFSIINGIARGILYLHEDSRLRIIHRDLKASNVLLDHEMNPKISDFGMARIFGRNQIEVNTNRVVGTYGYMAPEYAMEGLFSVKSDVFSFGVLLLEILSGKRNTGFYRYEHGQSLLTFAWKLWCEGKGMELMDPLVMESFVGLEVLKCIQTGHLCVQEDPGDRPTMSSVVVMLSSDTITLPQPKQPAFNIGLVVTEPTQSLDNNNVHSVNEATLSIVSPR